MSREEDDEMAMRKALVVPTSFEDLLAQFRAVQQQGGLHEAVQRMPGYAAMFSEDAEEELTRFRKILEAMTLTERKIPELVEGSRGSERRKQIAERAGVDPVEVMRVVKAFAAMQRVIAHLKSGGSIEDLADEGD